MDLNNLESRNLWLLETSDYREFIRRFLAMRNPPGKRINFAGFARKAGFASRSFPRDVVAGKRRITAASLPIFLKGMGLRGNWKIYFELLVALQETDTPAAGAGSASVKKRIEAIRTRLLQTRVSQESAAKLFSTYYRWLDIYAALGAPEQGSTLATISSRTRISESKCARILREMIEQGVVRPCGNGARYFATRPHLSIADFGGDRFVQKYYQDSLREVSAWAEHNFRSPHHLFSNSVFSMDSKRAAEFKRELRELIERFAENAEDPVGDRIARIIVAFGSV